MLTGTGWYGNCCGTYNGGCGYTIDGYEGVCGGPE